MQLGINSARRVPENFNRQRRWVNDVSHELRTPLTIIRGYADMLERYGSDDPDLFKEAVTSIKTSAQNMQNLVESLLFLSRAEQGYQTLMKAPVELDELLKKFVENYRSPRLQIEKLVPCKILADAEYIKKMFACFVDNALRYSPPDTPVTIELTTANDKAILKFIDRGIGISEEDCSKIFDSFYRTDKSRTKLKVGENPMGLGLPVAKWIADRHDITIDVDSKPGVGSTFTLTIPIFAE